LNKTSTHSTWFNDTHGCDGASAATAVATEGGAAAPWRSPRNETGGDWSRNTEMVSSAGMLRG
jgi:hypothetical protein